MTGPREWPSRYLVFFELSRLAQQHDLKSGIGQSLHKEKLTVVHGNNHRGVDHFAQEWALCYGIPEPHPANWRPGGRLDILAGFKRNQQMVDLGADMCLAFLMQCTRHACSKKPFHYTHGTWDCLTRARAAGIPVTECYYRKTGALKD